jgi:hypothetical protein
MKTDLENLLGQQTGISGNEIFYTCPGCGKADKFSVNNETGAYNCFVCGSEKIREAIKELRQQDVYHSFTPKTKTAPATGKQRKEYKPVPITPADLGLIAAFPISPNHKEQFLNKRDPKERKFLPGNNFISLTPELIKAVQEINPALGSQLQYYFSINYHLLIIYRDRENKPFTFRLYSFNPLSGKPKKLTIKGQKTALYGEEHVTYKTKRIKFVEGEEKAEAGNRYRKDESIVFLSIPGIGIHQPAIDFVKDNPGLQYSVLFDNDNRALEVKTGYLLATRLKEFTDNITLIDLPATKGKIDLDSYIKTFPEDKRTAALETLINNCYPLSDYFEKHITELFQQQERLKPKLTWKRPEQTEIKEYLTIDQAAAAGIDVLRNHTAGILLDLRPPGTRKTSNVIELTKEKKIIISAPNRKIRDEIAAAAGIDSNISLDEHCESTLNNHLDKLKPGEAESNFKEAKSIRTKGHNTYQYYCENNCKLSEICKNTKPKTTTASIVETHAMSLKRKNLNDFDMLVLDDINTLNVMIATGDSAGKIDYAEAARMIDFYTGSLELDLILKALRQFFDHVKIKLSGKNLSDTFKAFLKSSRYPSLKELKRALEPELIDKKLIQDKNLLPDGKNLTALLFAIDTDFRSAALEYDSLTDKYYLIIDYKKDFPTDKPISILDGTGDPELLQDIFPNQEIKVFNPPVKMEGITFNLVPNKTFNASNLFPANIDPKEAEITKLIETIAGNKKALAINPKGIKEQLTPVLSEKENITLDSYGDGNRGSNNHKHNDIAIVTPPSINLDGNIRKAKVLYNNIQIETCYKDVATGYIEPHKGEANISLIHFKDKRLNRILNQGREAEIKQGLSRVKRCEAPKEFWLLGNISLKKYGLIPDKIIFSWDIYRKSRADKHEIFKTFAKEFITEYLNKYPGFLKSEIYTLHNLIKFSTAETLDNCQFAVKTYNIYNLLPYFTANLDHIRNTAESIKSRQFYDLFDQALKELNLFETNFSLPGKPAGKIILKNEADLEAAKEFYKDIKAEPENNFAVFFPNLIIQMAEEHIKMVVSEMKNKPDPGLEAYNTFIKENELTLATDFENYLDNILTRGKILNDDYLLKFWEWIEQKPELSNTRFKWKYIYSQVIKYFDSINEQIQDRINTPPEKTPPVKEQITPIDKTVFKKRKIREKRKAFSHKDYVFHNNGWLAGINENAINYHLLNLGLDESKLNDFDYMFPLAKELSAICNISIEKASLFVSNFQFVNKKTINDIETNFIYLGYDSSEKTFKDNIELFKKAKKIIQNSKYEKKPVLMAGVDGDMINGSS